MTVLDNITKKEFETLFGMGSGYVLDFSDASFADFINTAVGFNPYERYPEAGSKARTLRAIWNNEPANVVARLLLEMLHYWKASLAMQGSEAEHRDKILYDELVRKMSDMAAAQPLTEDEQRFLQEDFSSIEPEHLVSDPESQTIRRNHSIREHLQL